MRVLRDSRNRVVYYECPKSTMSDNVSGFVAEQVHGVKGLEVGEELHL